MPNSIHNLLLVQKLLTDNKCQVGIISHHYVIVDNNTKEVRGVGRAKHGLYYLINLLLSIVPGQVSVNVVANDSESIPNLDTSNTLDL